MQQTIEARWRWSDSINRDGQQDPSSDRFIISQERADVTGGAGTLNFDVSGAKSSHTPSTSEPVHVYILFSNDDTIATAVDPVQEQVL